MSGLYTRKNQSLGSLLDVQLDNSVNNEVLTYENELWKNKASSGQVVTLTQGGATTITGTYPNFTISSTDTTYSAGTGLSLVGTTFSNTAPAPTPTFAGASMSQTISSNAETTLTAWTSQIATGITVGTPNVFTTATAGWYSLGFSLELEKPSGGGSNFEIAFLRIKQGGVNYHTLQNADAGTERNNCICFGGSILIQMSASQTISMTTQLDKANSYIVTGYVSLVKVD